MYLEEVQQYYLGYKYPMLNIILKHIIVRIIFPMNNLSFITNRI